MMDRRRINVALSRAKYGLILVGNLAMFQRKTYWRHIVAHLIQNGCIDGNLGMEWRQQPETPPILNFVPNVQQRT